MLITPGSQRVKLYEFTVNRSPSARGSECIVGQRGSLNGRSSSRRLIGVGCGLQHLCTHYCLYSIQNYEAMCLSVALKMIQFVDVCFIVKLLPCVVIIAKKS